MSDGSFRPLPRRNNQPVTSMIERYGSRILLLALLSLFGATGADAQVRRGRPIDEGPGWAPISLGPRIGYDSSQGAEIIGGQIHLPVLRSGRLELSAGADIVFLRGTQEHQYGVELVYATPGQGGDCTVGEGSVIGKLPSNPRRANLATRSSDTASCWAPNQGPSVGSRRGWSSVASSWSTRTSGPTQ